MRDYIELPSVPVCEECAQVGSDHYRSRAMAECQAFINQLKRVFGNPPEGARFAVKANDHDFGTYYDVRLSFDDCDPVQVDYSLRVDERLPEHWDDQARNELNLARFPGGVER